MSQPASIITYSGSTPGADSNTYPIWSSVTALGKGMLGPHGIKRVVVSLKNIAAGAGGTLNGYWSANGGTTWNQYDSQTVSDATSTATNTYDYDVARYRDFKVDWVNAGTAQSTWLVTIALLYERPPAT